MVAHTFSADLLSRAITSHRAGDIAAAESAYQEILSIDQNNFDALHLLGLIYHHRGEHERSMGLIRRSLQHEPGAFPAWTHLGQALSALGDTAGARASFEEAIRLNPDYADAHEQLAVLLRSNGEAEDALRAFERVVALCPGSARAHNNLGIALHELGRIEGARASYSTALDLDPALANAALNLGEALRLMGRHNESLALCRRAAEIDPSSPVARYNLGIALHVHGLHDEALEAVKAALALDPEYGQARLAITMLQLPSVHALGRTPDQSRRAFELDLVELHKWFSGRREHEGYSSVGSQQPFYLAYHDHNIVQPMSSYGDLCARLLSRWQEDQKLKFADDSPGEVIRLAIVSGHIFDHSVWTAITRGFCENLDPARVSIHIFYTNLTDDKETARARSLAASFLQGQRPLRRWVDAIRACQPDVILYPELGMDQMTAKLAALRLAPVQLAAWGHPITTGFPTVDGYLSAAAFEPADAQEHYRERLVALPGLGCVYRPLEVVPQTSEVELWGIDADIPLLLCAGTPYKYAPAQDHLYVEIARRLGRAKFVFFADMSERPSKTLQERLQYAFREGGLDPQEFLVLLPRQSRSAFFDILGRTDVYLDSIGFSGFNGVMQAIECGLPVVAHSGRYMRGRFGSGILERMGMADLVAGTDAEYVAKVVQLCEDSAYRNEVRTRVVRSRNVLFNDLAPVRALEDVLVQFVRLGVKDAPPFVWSAPTGPPPLQRTEPPARGLRRLWSLRKRG